MERQGRIHKSILSSSSNSTPNTSNPESVTASPMNPKTNREEASNSSRFLTIARTLIAGYNDYKIQCKKTANRLWAKCISVFPERRGEREADEAKICLSGKMTIWGDAWLLCHT